MYQQLHHKYITIIIPPRPLPIARALAPKPTALPARDESDDATQTYPKSPGDPEWPFYMPDIRPPKTW